MANSHGVVSGVFVFSVVQMRSVLGLAVVSVKGSSVWVTTSRVFSAPVSVAVTAVLCGASESDVWGAFVVASFHECASVVTVRSVSTDSTRVLAVGLPVARSYVTLSVATVV